VPVRAFFARLPLLPPWCAGRRRFWRFLGAAHIVSFTGRVTLTPADFGISPMWLKAENTPKAKDAALRRTRGSWRRRVCRVGAAHQSRLLA